MVVVCWFSADLVVPALNHAGQLIGIGARPARKRANFRKFWTVAASRNSFVAPVIARSRSRRKPKCRLRWAMNTLGFVAAGE